MCECACAIQSNYHTLRSWKTRGEANNAHFKRNSRVNINFDYVKLLLFVGQLFSNHY